MYSPSLDTLHANVFQITPHRHTLTLLSQLTLTLLLLLQLQILLLMIILFIQLFMRESDLFQIIRTLLLFTLKLFQTFTCILIFFNLLNQITHNFTTAAIFLSFQNTATVFARCRFYR